MQVNYWTLETDIFIKGSHLAVDLETTMVNLTQEIPDMIVGDIYDGVSHYKLLPKDVYWFVSSCITNEYKLYMHNAAFDLAVMAKHYSNADDYKYRKSRVYELVDNGQVYDTMLLYQLYKIATEGDYNKSSLDEVVKDLMGEYVEKKGTDRDGDLIRITFEKWKGRVYEMYSETIEYIENDTKYTYDVGVLLIDIIYKFLKTRLRRKDVFGYIDKDTLEYLIKKYGLLTHHIQLKGAIVLNDITRNGCHIDSKRVERFITENQAEIKLLEQRLADEYKYFSGTGSSKQLQLFMAQAEAAMGVRLPKTGTGKYSTSADTFRDYELEKHSPFFELYLKHKNLVHEVNNFLSKMYGEYGLFGANDVTIHPSFTPIKTTGRVSSWGAINSQNLPRKKGFRECFIPHKGNVFVVIDYAGIELCTLADAIHNQFHLTPTTMLDAINEGKDLHTETAKFLIGSDEVTKEDRQKAKAANFGLPGGMGGARLAEYAKNYGASITEEEGQNIANAWKDKYPEIRKFIHYVEPSGYTIMAEAIKFNPYGAEEYSDMQGRMLFKILSEDCPVSLNGNPYSQEVKNLAWTNCLRYCNDEGIDYNLYDFIRTRTPNKDKANKFYSLFGWNYCVTATGRFRYTTQFTERRNTIFQGLAADGMKLAMWNLFRQNYRISNVVHDEVIVEIPEDTYYNAKYKNICYWVTLGMKDVVKEVRIEVSGSICRRWSKDAQLIIKEGEGIDTIYGIWEEDSNET